MTKKLFIPGPVDVKEDVLSKMSKPLIGHRSKEASLLQRSITEKLKKIMYTSNEILLSTSSGSGLMEGAVRSCTRKRAAIFSIGAFGDRWHKMAVSNNIAADLYSSEPGDITYPEMVHSILSKGEYDLITITHNETSTGVMNPLKEISEVVSKFPDVVFCVDAVSSAGGTKIEVDRLGIDICITSSQKCLGLPPGMSICSISQKALNAAEKVKNRGFYFDLLEIYNYIKKRNYQYPSTPALSIMYAMDYQLDRILEEGLDNRFNRHYRMAEIVRDWATDRFKLFAKREYASNTLTTIVNTRNISIEYLNRELEKRDFLISNGYGNLKDKTFRIAHMADASESDIKELLNAIDEIIEE